MNGTRRSWCRAAAFVLLAGTAVIGNAHELQPGFLELRETDAGRYRVLWKQPLSAGQPMRLTPVFPARCRADGEPDAERLAQSWVYRARIACDGGLAGQPLAVEGLEAFSTDVLLRVEHADGRSETHLLKPDAPVIRLRDTDAGQGGTYFRLGIEHIALGIDHLLFVLGLLLLVDSRWMLLKTITSFTLAHSLTLAAATWGTLAVPAAPLNVLIALSILFLAPEVLRRRAGGSSLTIRHPWLVAFPFGLLHGFGFASGLAALGLPPGDIPLALLMFNLGIEAGQLAFVALVYLLLWSWRALAMHAGPFWRAVPVYVLGALGALWTMQRIALM